MLLLLMAIGAVLIPLHHFVQPRLVKKLVENNKAVKLRNAKKVIAEQE